MIVDNYKFVIISSPAASGKSSVLTLFANKYRQFKFLRVSFLDDEKSVQIFSRQRALISIRKLPVSYQIFNMS